MRAVACRRKREIEMRTKKTAMFAVMAIGLMMAAGGGDADVR